MLDTMTFTKTVGALCGALLIFLLGKWAAEGLYHTGGAHGEDHAMGYVIETGEGEPEEAAPEMSMEEILAAGDAAAGEKVWGKCRACHKLDGGNGTGPYLNGVVGRPVGGADGFGYSSALAEHGGDWTPDLLNAFLENPRGSMPGNKMSFAGLPDIEDRANLIAYLETFGG